MELVLVALHALGMYKCSLYSMIKLDFNTKNETKCWENNIIVR